MVQEQRIHLGGYEHYKIWAKHEPLETTPVMRSGVRLIYCAGGNKRLAQIAIDAGYLYGARVPRDKPHFPIYFADQDWKRPDRPRYMSELARHTPSMATVLDLERGRQLAEVLNWAEEAAQFCELVVVIPKVVGIINRIPRRIGGKDVVLGYSVATDYGHTPVCEEEFRGRMVHILGGSPHRQIAIWKRMKDCTDVLSVDGNYAQKMAVRYNRFWTNGNARYARNRYFPSLREADGKPWNGDAPYEAFRRSCANILKAWATMARQEW